jgi:Holliday junction resolvase
VPNRAYEAGNRFEKRVAQHLRDEGYVVWQTRGSKSAADLIALRVGQVLLVQVKGGVTTLNHEQWNALYDLARMCGALPVIADRNARQIRWRRIIDQHQPRTHDWPALPFTTDYATQ